MAVLSVAAASGGAEAAGSAAVRALSVVPRQTPRLEAPNFDPRSGTFPAVVGTRSEVGQVNDSIRKVVQDEAHRQQTRMVAFEKATPWLVHEPQRGEFHTSIDHTLISASSEVFSVLMPEVVLPPGGTTGDYWLAMTFRVPSGTPVHLEQLFSDGTAGVRALAKIVQSRLRRTNACIRSTIGMYPLSRWWVAPTERSYRHFALTPSGLAVGFDEKAFRLGQQVSLEIDLFPSLKVARIEAGFPADFTTLKGSVTVGAFASVDNVVTFLSPSVSSDLRRRVVKAMDALRRGSSRAVSTVVPAPPTVSPFTPASGKSEQSSQSIATVVTDIRACLFPRTGLTIDSPGPGAATLYVTAPSCLKALHARFLTVFRGPSYGYPHYFPDQHIRQFPNGVIYAWTAPPSATAADELLRCARSAQM